MNAQLRTVLFAGDINVDLMMLGLESAPVVDREIACTGFEVTLGSSAVICACAYASLGGCAVFMGLAGEDFYGDFLLHGMRTFGVDTRLVRRTKKVKTGVTVNLIFGRTRSQVTYPGTIAEFDGAEVGQDDLAGISHVHFAGPYLQTRFRPHLTRLLGTARRLEVTTSLDPQWDATEQWKFIDEWFPLLDFLFLNEDEAVSITGSGSAEDAIRLLAGKTACPVVKLGRRGAMVCERGVAQLIPTFESEVVDTTGAGDTFNAGFLFAVIEEGGSMREAVAFANAAAARSCGFAGGVTARSTRRDVVEFMRRRHERA